MLNEDQIQSAGVRTVQVPESLVQIVQALGHQLTRYSEATGRKEIDLTRALPLCMVLADNDVQRAANLCQSFSAALEDWSGFESGGDPEAQSFTGQPIP